MENNNITIQERWAEDENSPVTEIIAPNGRKASCIGACTEEEKQKIIKTLMQEG